MVRAGTCREAIVVKLSALLVSAALLLSGCNQAVVTPSPAAVRTPTAPAPPASASTLPQNTPQADAATPVRIYMVLALPDGTTGLVPVVRYRFMPNLIDVEAMTALLAGPSTGDAIRSPAPYTDIPAGTTLMDLTTNGAVATVDLSGEFASGGGTASVYGRLAQVVYTLTQFPPVTSVRFTIDGKSVSTFTSEHVVLDHALKRTDFSNELPAIFVDSPAWGEVATSPITVRGVANVFEAQFTTELRDAAGALATKNVTASCGTGCWGTFTTTLPYAVATEQWATLRVFSASAKDGTPENERIYPVRLSPAGG
jgi:spore germination protein GerM